MTLQSMKDWTDLRIVALDPSWMDQLARFYAGFESERRPLAFWQARLRNWWHQNPAMHAGWCMGMGMLVGEQMVGAIAAVPLRLTTSDGQRVAAALSTARVESNWRFASLEMIDRLLDHLRGTWIFDSTPTSGMAKLLGHYQFVKLHRQLLLDVLPGSLPSLLLRMAGSRPAPGRPAPYHRNGQPAAEEPFEALADELWGLIGSRLGTTLVRDAAFFRWLCVDNPTRQITAFISTSACGRPEAGAFCLDDGSGSLVVLDHWADPEKPRALSRLVSSIRKVATRHGFPLVKWHGFAGQAQRWGIRRAVENKSLVRWPDGTPSTGGAHWTLLAGDLGL